MFDIFGRKKREERKRQQRWERHAIFKTLSDALDQAQADPSKTAEFLTQHPWASKHANEWGVTALMIAAQHGHLEIFDMLMKAGADPAASDNFGKDTMAYAASARPTCRHAADIIRMLHAAGMGVNRADDFSISPLHFAVAFGNAAVLKELLAKGADTDAVDYMGLTPRELAVADKKPAGIVRLLGGPPRREKPAAAGDRLAGAFKQGVRRDVTVRRLTLNLQQPAPASAGPNP